MRHKSSKTTDIYTHVSMYKLNGLTNPLDYISFLINLIINNYNKHQLYFLNQ